MEPISAAILAGGSLLSGLLGGGDKKQEQGTQTVSNAPWSGIQPYLTGSGQLPSYLTAMPDMYLPWLQWAQGSGEGTNLDAPPPMMWDYIRAQQGIGTPGGRPAQASDRVSLGMQQAPQAQPQGPARGQYENPVTAGSRREIQDWARYYKALNNPGGGNIMSMGGLIGGPLVQPAPVRNFYDHMGFTPEG